MCKTVQKITPLKKLYDAQIAQTPQYKSVLDKRLSGLTKNEKVSLDNISSLILRLVGNCLDQFCLDYKWICDTLLQEEIHFRRTGEYRHKKFDEVYEEVYSDPEIMEPYMNGLLMTQVWWPNHTQAITYLAETFLLECPNNYSLLEIGPGHGLLSYFPAMDTRCIHQEAWDVSKSSLDATSDSLDKLGVGTNVYLKEQNLYAASSEPSKFDAIIFSEVLEHLEEPKKALEILSTLLNPEGRLYIHMPINSPAPDHLFNMETPQDFVEFVESCGLMLTEKLFFPMAGYNLEQAIQQKLTISCILVAEVDN